MKRDNRLSSLCPTLRKITLCLGRYCNANEEFRLARRKIDAFETGRSKERHAELIRQKKTWVDVSMHQNGSAVDFVICKKFLTKVVKYYWDKDHLYDVLMEAADRFGLCSYGLTYGVDIYHFELPIIWQPESDCFAYAVINALRWKSRKWRLMEKKDAAREAEVLQAESKTRTLEGILDIAKKFGWIKDFEEVEPENIEGTGCYVVQTRNRYLGKNRTQKIKRMIKKGEGIPGHATAVAEKDHRTGGILTLNSHGPNRSGNFTYPAQYLITNLSKISKAYKIILNDNTI